MKMKKLKLFMLFAAFAFCSAANAQVDNTLQFVDANGEVVENGAVVNGVVEYKDMGEYGGYYQVSTGLSVRNNTSDYAGVQTAVDLKRIDNGSFSCCFPGTCQEVTSTGTYTTRGGVLNANELKSFETEWIPVEYGQCEATFKLEILGVDELFGMPVAGNEVIAEGPTVTVKFVYDENTTGINNITTSEGHDVVAYYSLDGQKQNTPKKGINIVKYKNGKTAKIVVK